MSRRSDADWLNDILEAVRRVVVYMENVSYEQFLQDTKTQDAVTRNLEIIGEAAKQVSASMREAHPGVPWKGMAAVRDRLIHAYFGVNLDIVWQIATAELPIVRIQIEEIVAEEQQDSS